MKRILAVFAVVAFCLLPLTALAGEGPMKLPDGSNASANMHNEEGIKHWNKGHFKIALAHFSEASKADHSIGETHFNEAISMDKLGSHKMAAMHFMAAKKNANGNEKIINSLILNAHLK